jgi:hypothetical protein
MLSERILSFCSPKTHVEYIKWSFIVFFSARQHFPTLLCSCFSCSKQKLIYTHDLHKHAKTSNHHHPSLFSALNSILPLKINKSEQSQIIILLVDIYIWDERWVFPQNFPNFSYMLGFLMFFGFWSRNRKKSFSIDFFFCVEKRVQQILFHIFTIYNYIKARVATATEF